MHGGVCSKVARGICPWNVELFFFSFLFPRDVKLRGSLSFSLLPAKKKEEKKGRLKRSRLIGLVISSQDCFMKPVCSQMSCLFFFSFDCMAAFAPPTAPLLRTLLARFSLIPPPTHTGRTAVFPTNNWLLEKKKSIEGWVTCHNLFNSCSTCETVHLRPFQNHWLHQWKLSWEPRIRHAPHVLLFNVYSFISFFLTLSMFLQKMEQSIFSRLICGGTNVILKQTLIKSRLSGFAHEICWQHRAFF